eukprot:COSAG03_NODE_19462_length_336_cov_0.746835_1_plen_26_part_01
MSPRTALLIEDWRSRRCSERLCAATV